VPLLLSLGSLSSAACSSDGPADVSGAGTASNGGSAGTDGSGAGAAGANAKAGAAGAGTGGDDPQPGAGDDPVALPARIARYLRATSPSLIIEVDAVAGLEPYAPSAPYLGGLLSELLDKPEGITFESDETLESVGSDHEWTFDELSAFAREHARSDEDGPVRIHVLSLDGRYFTESGGTVLGLAWGNRYVALFQDAIRGRCESGLLGALQSEICEIAERSVWAHELGHTLGLVDNGIPMLTNHRDPEHGRHEAQDGCLMYWAYEGAEIFDTLLTRFDSDAGELDFCEPSRADLMAAK
jgi:hypothetical protein